MSVRALLAVAALALPLGGCFAVQEKTFGESLDEATTGTQIKSRLFSKGAFSRFGEVDVEVADRFVLLSGRVPSEADRREAERIAWSVPSVDEVANELVVEARDASRDVNDRWITEQVRARLIGNSDVKGVNYNIQVYDGVVYLMGFARSEAELQDAAETAARVRGVQRVVSYVKMRDRGLPPVTEAALPSDPQPLASLPEDTQEPAPIVPPTRAPTTRQQYNDPYAPGSTPPPGASSNSGGLSSAPLQPLP